MANYKKEDIESAKRLAIKEAGGLANLTNDVVSAMYSNLGYRDGCARYVRENVLVYTADRRAWLDRRGIKYKTPDATFNAIFTLAVADVTAQYIKKHGLSLERHGNGYYLIKTRPMTRRTTKRR